MEINYNKHIWEGWRIKDFIDELEYAVDNLICNSIEFHITVTRKDIEKCCIDNQPYFKKVIPEVVEHFCQKYNIK